MFTKNGIRQYKNIFYYCRAVESSELDYWFRKHFKIQQAISIYLRLGIFFYRYQETSRIFCVLAPFSEKQIIMPAKWLSKQNAIQFKMPAWFALSSLGIFYLSRKPEEKELELDSELSDFDIFLFA